MLRKLLFSGLLIPFLALSGCGESGAVKPVSEGGYFDVPGFMQKQLGILYHKKPALQKMVWVNHEKPETRQLQQVNWNEELQHFLEVDLNKKALAGSYIVSESSSLSGKTMAYTLKPEEKAVIKTLKVTIKTGGGVQHLQVISEDKNALFYNREERMLTLGPQGVVQRYHINGVQKVLFFDSLHYAVKGNIVKIK